MNDYEVKNIVISGKYTNKNEPFKIILILGIKEFNGGINSLSWHAICTEC